LNVNVSGSSYYDGDSAANHEYGRLYSWFAASTSCPEGWHLPTDEEWKELEMFLGMTQEEANATDWRGGPGHDLKEAGTAHWTLGYGNNSSGFTALPGGYISGVYSNKNGSAYFWAGEEGTSAWYRRIHDEWGAIYRSTLNKIHGASVRCVKD